MWCLALHATGDAAVDMMELEQACSTAVKVDRSYVCTYICMYIIITTIQDYAGVSLMNGQGRQYIVHKAIIII